MSANEEYEHLKLAQDRYAVVGKGWNGHIAIAENEVRAERIAACLNFCAGNSNVVLGMSTLKNVLTQATEAVLKEEKIRCENVLTNHDLSRIKKENERLQAELDRVTKLRQLSEYHEDYHDVLWFTAPIEEPPAYIGSPLDDDFPDYVTHFAHLPRFVCPIKGQ